MAFKYLLKCSAEVCSLVWWLKKKERVWIWGLALQVSYMHLLLLGAGVVN